MAGVRLKNDTKLNSYLARIHCVCITNRINNLRD